jgi:hypothetical protein
MIRSRASHGCAKLVREPGRREAFALVRGAWCGVCKTVGSVAADQSGDDESYGQPQIPVP